mgnify:CR=1 FL=1
MRFCFHVNGIDLVRNEIRLHTNPIVLLCKDPWCKCVETMYLCKSIHKELLFVCKQKSNLLRQVRVIALANVTSHTRGRTTMWRNETESAGNAGTVGSLSTKYLRNIPLAFRITFHGPKEVNTNLSTGCGTWQSLVSVHKTPPPLSTCTGHHYGTPEGAVGGRWWFF